MVNGTLPGAANAVRLSFSPPVLLMSRRAPTRFPCSAGRRVARNKPASADRFPATDALSDPRLTARLGTHSMGSAALAIDRLQAPGDAPCVAPAGARVPLTDSRLRPALTGARRGEDLNVQEYVDRRRPRRRDARGGGRRDPR